MKMIARFVGQAWINDNAVAVDPLGQSHWDVTESLKGRENALTASERDDLRDLDNAPDWARNWTGPFEVIVDEVDDFTASRILDLPAPPLPDLSIDIPDSEGLKGRAFRTALESMRVALISAGVETQIVRDACFTAIEAYGNNDVDTHEVQEVLMVSTGHLPPHERLLFSYGRKPVGADAIVPVFNNTYGFMLYIEPEDATPEFLQRLRTMHSSGLTDVVARAISLGTQFIRFDCDGPYLAGIERYDDHGMPELAA